MRGSLPKKSVTVVCTKGIRVCPPTKITSCISEGDSPASANAVFTGSNERVTRSSTKDSSLDRDNFTTRCLGPVASAVMYGRLTSVCWALESSILAFSAASLRRCRARGSPCRSMPFSRLNSSAKYSINRRSKSSPPRKVSPLVARTSN